MVDLADLPLTDELRRGLEDWVAQWHELAEPGVVTEGDAPPPEAWRGFHADGATLAARLRSELGPAWSVEYSR